MHVWVRWSSLRSCAEWSRCVCVNNHKVQRKARAGGLFVGSPGVLPLQDRLATVAVSPLPVGRIADLLAPGLPALRCPPLCAPFEALFFSFSFSPLLSYCVCVCVCVCVCILLCMCMRIWQFHVCRPMITHVKHMKSNIRYVFDKKTNKRK